MNIETRVSQLTGRYLETWNDGDPDGYAALWTTDAIFWVPTGTELTGRDAIRNWAEEQCRTATNLTMEPIRCDSFVEAIFVVGNYTCERTDTAPPHIRGGFVAVLLDAGERTPKMHRLFAFRGEHPPWAAIVAKS